MTEQPAPFDLDADLPADGTTTVLEASAGTGKTWTVGALVTRYVAEGRARLDELLVVTFGRAASQELRERVRDQLVEAERALADPGSVRPSQSLLVHLVTADVPARRRRVAEALASFDAATIATTHQFCHLVLRSLGVAGDTDGHARLVESLDDLVVEVTDDLYLLRFGDQATPPFPRAVALEVARRAVGDPQAELAPVDAPADSLAAARVAFAEAVREEVTRRKHRRGVLSYDDLLSRLAEALKSDDAPARDRMRGRWKVVLVDEFQDTDPVQWQVIDRAFSGHATLVLIGDPKQAIYAFRGGDIVTYLDAAGTAGERRTLAVNHRSDAPLVDALQVLTRGAALGDPRITVLPVEAARRTSRLAGLPVPDPFRLRVVREPGRQDGKTIASDRLRPIIAADLAADVARLLTSGATYDDPVAGVRPVGAGDVAILMFSLSQVGVFRDALRDVGVPSVVTSGGNVLLSRAGDEWLTLLEALERQAPRRVRALALTSFVGETPLSLDDGGDALTDRIGERARGWLDLFRSRGVAAVHEAAHAAGMSGRVLGRPDGERLLTDLDHLGQVLHEAARRERLGLPALLEWLRAERRAAVASVERTRRLDTDAAAVQIVTFHGSKGLQYPVVYLPWSFDRWRPAETVHRFHHEGRRALDVGYGTDSPYAAQAREEEAAEELRLTYVALTRAQSQVVAWFAPSWFAPGAGLSRLLFGRGPGEATVPESVSRGPSDAEIDAVLGRWQSAGALRLEVVGPPGTEQVAPPAPPGPLDVRSFDRGIDTAWRRTSYSGLIRAADDAATSSASEPEVEGTVDESPTEETRTVAPTSDDDLVSPMADLPSGATLGSLVHGVLEHADPDAPDLAAELRRHVVEQQRWWSVDATADVLAQALLPMQHTSLGPLADDLTLAQIPLDDRLRELEFEFPLVGGDRRQTLPDVLLRQVADVLRTHLPADDPMRAYATSLEAPALGEQVLRGYLSGSIDVVLRVGGRYVVVDYKTNRLGQQDRPLTARDYTQPLVTEAMLHSHYPLQALLYSVVLHRYLRWRLPGYDPASHLGGILYLYVRGMCGPATPVVDGQPCGVFAWQPPAVLVEALSDLLGGHA